MAAIGYARVSTTDQDLALQLDAFAKAGCARVFEDKASGAKANRPGLAAALGFVREGDILTVWKLDRLGRSLPHLIETVNALEARGVSFRSLTETIDTTTPGGRLIFHIFGALGQSRRRGGARPPRRTQARHDGRKVPARPSPPRPRLHRSRGRGSHQGRQDSALHRARPDGSGTCRRRRFALTAPPAQHMHFTTRRPINVPCHYPRQIRPPARSRF
jgi:Resolvase, N terminal domain